MTSSLFADLPGLVFNSAGAPQREFKRELMPDSSGISMTALKQDLQVFQAFLSVLGTNEVGSSGRKGG